MSLLDQNQGVGTGRGLSLLILNHTHMKETEDRVFILVTMTGYMDKILKIFLIDLLHIREMTIHLDLEGRGDIDTIAAAMVVVVGRVPTQDRMTGMTIMTGMIVMIVMTGIAGMTSITGMTGMTGITGITIITEET